MSALSNETVLRAEAKQSQGKLVAVTLWVKTCELNTNRDETHQGAMDSSYQPQANRERGGSSPIIRVRIDGDFFDSDMEGAAIPGDGEISVVQQLEQILEHAPVLKTKDQVSSLACALDHAINTLRGCKAYGGYRDPQGSRSSQGYQANQGHQADNQTQLRSEHNVNTTEDSRIVGISASTVLLAYLRVLRKAQQGGILPITSQLLTCEIRSLEQQVQQPIATTAMQQDGATPQKKQHDSSCEVISRYASRWQQLHPLILEPAPLPSAMHMALDITLAQAVASGEIPPILRFWGWSEPTVVLGAHQSVQHEIHQEEAQRRGFTVMRRITGGGTMIVRPEQSLTYSLTVPQLWAKTDSSLDTYQQCSWWIIEALQGLGITARFAPLNDLEAPDGGKIGGAAAKYFAAPSTTASTPASSHAPSSASTPAPQSTQGSLLYHATLAYHITPEDFTAILRTSEEKLRDKTRNNHTVTSADKRVSPLIEQTSLTYHMLLTKLIQHAATLRGAQTLTMHDFTQRYPHIVKQARQLTRDQFENPEWTYRL